ncbi:MAG: ABC transporter permease, partial [Deltaproteobacteria bacterium]|nr:ABC transporter permease [Deltaproteobacteria bacterium]
MAQLLRIAWRSIWRSRRRTLINMSAVAFGLTFLLFGIGLLEAITNQASNDLGNTGSGHLEIFARDYRVRRDVRRAIADPDAVVAKLTAAAPPGARVGWRVVVQGLVSGAWGSRGARVYGVDPAVEAKLSNFIATPGAGQPLAADDQRGIVIGAGLARRLKLNVGDKVRVMAQRADGEVGAELFRVRGIFSAISPAVEDGQVYVAAAAAQRLLGQGNVAHQVLAQLPSAEQSAPLAAAIKSELGDGYEVLSFAELFPALQMMQQIMDKAMFIAIFVIYFLVGLGVLNTVLMSVLERTREFGVMLAVGTRRQRLVAQVVAESLWIATIAVAIGLACGGAVCWL